MMLFLFMTKWFLFLRMDEYFHSDSAEGDLSVSCDVFHWAVVSPKGVQTLSNAKANTSSPEQISPVNCSFAKGVEYSCWWWALGTNTVEESAQLAQFPPVSNWGSGQLDTGYKLLGIENVSLLKKAKAQSESKRDQSDFLSMKSSKSFYHPSNRALPWIW